MQASSTNKEDLPKVLDPIKAAGSEHVHALQAKVDTIRRSVWSELIDTNLLGALDF